MFRGNHPTRVDEKGRLKMPEKFKDQLSGGEEAKQVFYITSKDGKRAEIWPMAAWAEVEAKLAKIPNMNPAKQKFLDVTNYYGQTVEMDGQGRLLIPQVLRESANIGDGVAENVVVLGMQTYFEVANRGSFEAEMKAAPLSAADMAQLSDLGV